MDYKLVIQELKKMGDTHSHKPSNGHALEKQFLGVNLTKLKSFAKELQRNHELASHLWKSDVYDAQILATLIEDPKMVCEEQINQWVKDIDSADLADKFCANILLKTPYAYKKMKEWIRSSDPYTKRCGFVSLALLSKKDEWLSDEEYLDFLNNIRTQIHIAENMVKEAMNQALICIGSRSKKLNEKALIFAEQIGELQLDNGYSNVRLPNAVVKLSDKKLQTKLSHQLVI